MHGYGIGQRIRQLADEMLTVEEGTLYPALYQIEGRGWIRSECGMSDNNRRDHFYRLTRARRKQLALEESRWEHLVAAIHKVSQAN
jgi:PadR family transcriptional regulator PadR